MTVTGTSPRWYFGWNVLAVALVFQGVTFGIAFYSFTFFVEPWMAEFDASRGRILFAVTVSQLAIGVLGPFAGKALDKGSIRAFVCLGGTLFALGFVVISQANSAMVVVITYATLIGAGLVLAGNLAGQTLAAKWFRARRGFAIGLVSVGTSIGGFLMPPLVTWLMAAFGWREACLVLAALTFVLIVPAAWLIIRNTPEDKGVLPEEDSDHSRAQAESFKGQVWTTATIFRTRAFWVAVIAFLPAATAFGGMQQNLGPFTADLGITPQKASLLMSVIAGTMIGGKLVFGGLADRVDNRFLFWTAIVFLIIPLFIMMGAPSYGLLVIAAASLGIAAGGNLPLMGSIVSQHFGPQAFGRVMGLLMPFLTLSSFGPVLAGWVRDTAGTYDAAFQAFILILVPAAIGMGFLPKPGRRAQPAEQAKQPAG